MAKQEVRIRLYGKAGCDQCNKAKDKLERMGLQWEFVDVATWLKHSEDWRERTEETVHFLAAYYFYYPMPLPLFRFNDSEYFGYADGLAMAKDIRNHLKERLAENLLGASNIEEHALAVA